MSWHISDLSFSHIRIAPIWLLWVKWCVIVCEIGLSIVPNVVSEEQNDFVVLLLLHGVFHIPLISEDTKQTLLSCSVSDTFYIRLFNPNWSWERFDLPFMPMMALSVRFRPLSGILFVVLFCRNPPRLNKLTNHPVDNQAIPTRNLNDRLGIKKNCGWGNRTVFGRSIFHFLCEGVSRLFLPFGEYSHPNGSPKMSNLNMRKVKYGCR